MVSSENSPNINENLKFGFSEACDAKWSRKYTEKCNKKIFFVLDFLKWIITLDEHVIQISLSLIQYKVKRKENKHSCLSCLHQIYLIRTLFLLVRVWMLNNLVWPVKLNHQHFKQNSLVSVFTDHFVTNLIILQVLLSGYYSEDDNFLLCSCSDYGYKLPWKKQTKKNKKLSLHNCNSDRIIKSNKVYMRHPWVVELSKFMYKINFICNYYFTCLNPEEPKNKCFGLLKLM